MSANHGGAALALLSRKGRILGPTAHRAWWRARDLYRIKYQQADPATLDEEVTAA
jgi:hypothetical protein